MHLFTAPSLRLPENDIALLALTVGKRRSGPIQLRIAKALMHKFGSLGAVLQASPEELCANGATSVQAANEIKMLRWLVCAAARAEISNRPVLEDFEALSNYCRVAISSTAREEFHVLFLDRSMHLITGKCMQVGTVDHVAVYPREVLALALQVSACALILVHNHPSNNDRPSAGDIAMTRQLEKAAEPFAIKIADHVIVGKEKNFSFREYGLL